MRSLAEHMLNNATLALMGVTFINPFFRRMAGQLPFEIPTYTLYIDDDTNASLEIAQIQKDKRKSFVVVIRDQNAQLEDVVFVPNADECMSIVQAGSRYCFGKTKTQNAPVQQSFSFSRHGHSKKSHVHSSKSTQHFGNIQEKK